MISTTEEKIGMQELPITSIISTDGGGNPGAHNKGVTNST